jgi:ferrous iron transport protein A
VRRLADIDTATPEGVTATEVRPHELTPLSEGGRGFAGVITRLSANDEPGGLSATELERRLLEMGFVEGAKVEILHEGFIARDPIAVKLDDMRVALRRRDARGVLVRPVITDAP